LPTAPQELERIKRRQQQVQERAQQALERKGVSRYSTMEIEEVEDERPASSQQGQNLCNSRQS
jgi:hypothetical protein